MNKYILNTDIHNFIKNNINTDISSLLFKKPLFDSVSNKELVEQLIGKKKCEKKLPLWFETNGIYYPPKLNLEQTSSEETAAYKASLLGGKRIVDITGGFGIDAYYFSLQYGEVVHCELQNWLSEIVQHNALTLGRENLQFYKGDGLEFLEETNDFFDVIYVDPSRRNDAKGKVFMLADCLPNVPNNLELLFSKSDTIMIKTSPILDISNGLEELKNVAEIHVVALQNEVKELLWILRKNHTDSIQMKTVNLGGNSPINFDFNWEEEPTLETSFSAPKKYLYEPNSAIMKAGAFKSISVQFGLSKLHQHSHLYTSDELVDFPGRVFEIVSILPHSKKVLKQELGGTKAHITSRNFPDKPDVFRKKYRVKDGGDVYIFLTTNLAEEKLVIITKKVSYVH
ncbi:class I SAM-dependent methyltransferase [Pustulibacterium marinum]|uniref:class I SAM-dependent methyltransferase n=1 Tax=Pustulibacterium marinum TaxID=1224947 RepID=UPI000B84CEAF|nr:class I SAM-dependent methyltransferase [Pustulibacterium marinum]